LLSEGARRPLGWGRSGGAGLAASGLVCGSLEADLFSIRL